MRTRRLTAVCLVIVIGLAGCSGLAPFGESENATETHDITYPDGYDESGITDPETAIDQHESALNDADSFTLGQNISTEISLFNFTMDFEAKQNSIDEQRVYSAEGDMEGKTIMKESEYNSDDTTYEMKRMEDEPVEYEAYPDSFGSETSINQDFISTWLTNATFGEATRDTHDGEQVFRYEATDAEGAEPFVMDLEENPALNVFNGTLLVAEDGVVQSFSYTMNYTTTNGTEKTIAGDYQVTDLNSTTVEEPDWVETAREQT